MFDASSLKVVLGVVEAASSSATVWNTSATRKLSFTRFSGAASIFTELSVTCVPRATSST